MQHSFISSLFIGFFLLSFSSVHAQVSWQFYGGTEVYHTLAGNNIRQMFLGVEPQFPIGNRTVLGTGLSVNSNENGWFRFTQNLRNNFQKDNSNSIESNGFIEDPVFAFFRRTPSALRIDLPVYFGIRLGKDRSLPLLLKLGASNEFSRTKFEVSTGTVTHKIYYGFSWSGGLQIPFNRGETIGFSIEPFYTYGRNLDVPSSDIFGHVDLILNVHSFGLRFSTHIL